MLLLALVDGGVEISVESADPIVAGQQLDACLRDLLAAIQGDIRSLPGESDHRFCFFLPARSEAA